MKYCKHCNATYEYRWNYWSGESAWIWIHEADCNR